MTDSGLEDVKGALAQVLHAVQRTVRAELLVDRMTGLGNDEALTEWIQTRIDMGTPFWLAFIEVDYFKSVNDRFGYEPANDLLRSIGEQLKNAAQHYFPDAAIPFRAHGDEFYLGGTSSEGGVALALDRLTLGIAALRVRAVDKADPMSCTVSVGWTTSADAQQNGDLSVLSLRGLLENAVADAKNDRNCVRRYDPTMIRPKMRDGRQDCKMCHAKFTLRIPEADGRAGELACPNCSALCERPASLRP